MFPEEGKDPLVSMCFSLMRSDEKEPNTTVALQLSECDPVPGARTIWFDDEKTLLMAFRDLFITYDPDIVTGYNTNNFDWPYLIERAKVNFAKFT